MTDNIIELDNVVIPFRIENAAVRGEIARLKSSINDVLKDHNYPEVIAKMVAKMVILTSLLGSSIKFKGRLIIQTQTSGPLNMLVVDYHTDGNYENAGKFRASARFNKKALAALETTSDAELLGTGQMVITIDQGGDMKEYQGIVALDNISLEEAARQYFGKSEQMLTEIRLAAEFDKDNKTWNAGGLMIQSVAAQGGSNAELDEEELKEQQIADWENARALMLTVKDNELISDKNDSQGLLFQLFHEKGVRCYMPQPLEAFCQCSVERIEDMLSQFSQQERVEMAQENPKKPGYIQVACDFCGKEYEFTAEHFSQ
ncbi:MAG: Hsp33 family molecular chaperone HslO [Rhizobiales bacterium]|nr:Hsp33 family molecular chaperone HslO [Hyphomicrobiales bacterium]NRB15314.1 Hsp33 family molecular chaperone HslO [Hyphomicrobiales bacterium]